MAEDPIAEKPGRQRYLLDRVQEKWPRNLDMLEEIITEKPSRCRSPVRQSPSIEDSLRELNQEHGCAGEI